ncbi:lipid A deacylase LpxR family protein [Paraflavitalea soli]|uniref:lipid A deacylase LpxR family protein n=1 Tax=Paraflavitalea soli TaxID=2315862 RepID=UPI0013C44ED1|nr:lipid A deacylase LpxR family protein [Paraflavitalea soli]
MPFSAIVAQQQPGNRYMFRVYEDNDAMNLYELGSDKGYTNGTRLDFFWQQQKRSFLNKLLPQAGSNSINTHGWGLMQVIITPDNILRRRPDPADYPYSAAMFVTRSLHSSNPVKKLSFQSEIVLGVMGPPALGEETQKLIHRIIQAQAPRGWDYQKPTDLLLNYHFTVNKQLAQLDHWAELIGSGQVFAGTMVNGAAVYTTLRLGKMNPYFDGLIQQFSSDKTNTNRWQFYFIVQPAAELVLTNALLEGGVFNHNEKLPVSTTGETGVPDLKRRRVITRIDWGAVLSHGNVAVSFTQKSSSALYKGFTRQEVGNISLHVAW